MASDHGVLTAKREAGKAHKIPRVLRDRCGGEVAERSDWPKSIARNCKKKRNRVDASTFMREFDLRLHVLEARGREMYRVALGGVELHVGVTVLLQALAAMNVVEAEGCDGISAEALKALDWHSLIKIRQGFQKRLLAESGCGKVVSEWKTLIAQCIPKSGAAST